MDPELMFLLCSNLRPRQIHRSDAENFVEFERWAQNKLAFLRRLLPLERGICSPDTLNDVMTALPAALIAECFTAWSPPARARPRHRRHHGKTSRRARRGDDHPLHLVSAWASRQRPALGQQPVAGKDNEVTAIPVLLDRLELTGKCSTGMTAF